MIKMIDIWVDGITVSSSKGSTVLWAYVVEENGRVLKQNCIQERTNQFPRGPVGTYHAICAVIQLLRAWGVIGDQIRFYSDNIMVVRQMNGLWKVKDQMEEYVIYYDIAKNEIRTFRDLTFTWITLDDKNKARPLVTAQLKKLGISIDKKEAV